jgi:hypothetical protein
VRILLSIFFSLTLVGCSVIPAGTNKDNEIVKTESWQVSPTFELTDKNEKGETVTAKFRGEKDRLAVSSNPFKAGKEDKYMWLLWAEKSDELVGKKAKIVGTNKVGERIDIPMRTVTLGGENYGSTAHLPSLFSLPYKGLWRLDVFVEQKLFGSIVVDVQ